MGRVRGHANTLHIDISSTSTWHKDLRQLYKRESSQTTHSHCSGYTELHAPNPCAEPAINKERPQTVRSWKRNQMGCQPIVLWIHSPLEQKAHHLLVDSSLCAPGAVCNATQQAWPCKTNSVAAAFILCPRNVPPRCCRASNFCGDQGTKTTKVLTAGTHQNDNLLRSIIPRRSLNLQV